MNPILITTDIQTYLKNIADLDCFPSALAFFDTHGEILYQNPSFDGFNTSIKDSTVNLFATDQLIHCENIQHWLKSVSSSPHCEKYSSTFYYSKNITVDLNLLSTPIINTQNTVLGRMVTIGEEALVFNKHHLARLQESNKKLKNRIIQLSQDKHKHDKLIRILLRNAPFALIIFNDQQQIIQTNAKAEKMFELSAGQMIGKHCTKILNCYQHDTCKALCHSDAIETDDLNGILTSGNTLNLLRSTEKLIDKNETLIIEAFIDTTSIKQAQSEIKRLGEVNTLLVNSTGEGILSIDTDLKFTFINKAGLNILNYKFDDLLGKSIHHILASDMDDTLSADDHQRIILDSIKTNTSKKNDATFKNIHGQLIPIQYSCSPLYIDDEVCGAVLVFRNVSEARAIAKKLDHLATHDSLTGLLNRYAFEIRLSHLLEESCISSGSHVLCFIDLDQFKIVNDTAGHIAGDALLRQITDLVNLHIRKSDVFARLGGDEYGLLLSNCGLEKAHALVEVILHNIIDYRFSWEDNIFTVGASIGLVELNSQFNDVSSALNAADSACYIAKKNGRQRVHIYQHNDDDITKHKLEFDWVNKIKDGLLRNKFQLWQQPIVAINDIHSKKHFEILIRMQDDDNQIISPASFIPIAERYNLMSDIDKWVIQSCIRYLITTDLNKIDLVAINISGQSITDDLFIDFIQTEFTKHPELTKFICFEITETAAISNLTKAAEFMKFIKKLGFSFALDDFGSGMSSFAYLKHLPIDYLKIDGNFIKDIERDHIDLAMVKAIHSVGKAIGIKTIAEFVESKGIIGILSEIGIDYVQGYAIDKPKPLLP